MSSIVTLNIIIINYKKSKAIVLGKHDEKLSGIHILDNSLQTLGIGLTNDVESIPDLNFKEWITKLPNLLNMWKQRELSINGKITIINSLVFSQIMYVASVLYISSEIIADINGIIFSFLWAKKIHVKLLLLLHQF